MIEYITTVVTVITFHFIVGMVFALIFSLIVKSNTTHEFDHAELFVSCFIFGFFSFFYILERHFETLSNILDNSEHLKKIKEREFVVPTKKNREKHLIKTLKS